MENSPLDILQKYWKHKSFRPGQEAIIQSVLSGRDTLALLPTGGGKSICFQVPALCMDGLCVVVSPLIALMNDQVDNLKKLGIRAMAITSVMKRKEIEIALQNCVNGGYKFLYVSPERLKTSLFLDNIQYLNISLIAIDESHCISQWGYDFRPSYLDISLLRDEVPKVPVIALTASATNEVVLDIQEKLKFKNQQVFKNSFARKNLQYIVFKEENKIERLVKIANSLKGSGVVYVRNRRKTQEVAQLLVQSGISADYYNAGIQPALRKIKQENWIANKFKVMVATNAFGMGIDKPDVRFVVHLDLPDSLEAYFQEAGRAGRDGKTAYAVMLFQNYDALSLEEQIESAFPSKEALKQSYQAICNYYQIAVGAGQGVSVDFSLDEIATKYNIKAYQIYNSIRFLEREGYVAYQDNSYEPSRLHILSNHEELYNLQVKYVQYDLLIKVILRSYGGVLDDYVKIQESILATRCKVSVPEVVDALKRLAHLGYIDYIPQTGLPTLVFTSNRIDAKHITFSDENYKTLKAKAIERMNAVVSYVKEDKVCRNRILLNYFNESDFEDCGVCDVCRARKNQLHSHELNEIKTQIKLLLQNHQYSMSEIVSSLYRFKQDEVIEACNELIDDNELEELVDKKIKLK